VDIAQRIPCALGREIDRVRRSVTGGLARMRLHEHRAVVEADRVLIGTRPERPPDVLTR